MKLTRDQQDALLRYLLQRFSVWVRDKEDADVIRALAEVFDVAAFFGLGVPTGEEFMTRWWTTVGTVVFAPRGHGPLVDHLRVLMHEIMHVVQFWRDGVSFVIRYCTRKGRAELEAEAERAAVEVWYILTGEIPAALGELSVTKHGYALDDAHVAHTVNLLHTAVTSVANGIISTDVGLEVLVWLRQNAPDGIAGRVA